MDPYTTVTPITDTVVPSPVGGGWHRAWVLILLVLKVGIPVIGGVLLLYVLYRWWTKGTRNGQKQATKVNDIAAVLKAMSPEERQAYMEKILRK